MAENKDYGPSCKKKYHLDTVWELSVRPLAITGGSTATGVLDIDGLEFCLDLKCPTQ